MCSLWRIIWANPSPERRRRRHIWATVVFWPTQCCCQLRWGHVIPDINCYPRFWYAHIPDMPFIITLQLLHSWDAAFIAFFQFLAWSVPSVTLWHNSFVKMTMQCRIRWQQITILEILILISQTVCVWIWKLAIFEILCSGFVLGFQCPLSTSSLCRGQTAETANSGAYFPDTDHSSRGGYSVLARGGGNKKLMMKNKDFCALHTMDSD